MKINEEDVYNSFYEFYHKGSNKVEILRDKSTDNFESWDKWKFIKLAKDNLVKFLLKSESDSFIVVDGALMALYDEMKEIIEEVSFMAYVWDAIKLRTGNYYEERIL